MIGYNPNLLDLCKCKQFLYPASIQNIFSRFLSQSIPIAVMSYLNTSFHRFPNKYQHPPKVPIICTFPADSEVLYESFQTWEFSQFELRVFPVGREYQIYLSLFNKIGNILFTNIDSLTFS